jgi:phosphoribosylamine--glycine ligase
METGAIRAHPDGVRGPGNGGTARDARLVNVNITDLHELANFVESEGISLTVVGPETLLAGGIVNLFRARGLKSSARPRKRRSWSRRKTSPKPSCSATASRLPNTRLSRTSRKPTPTSTPTRADRHQGRRPGRRQRVVAMTLEEAHAAVDTCPITPSATPARAS